MEQQTRYIIELPKEDPAPLGRWLPVIQTFIWPVVLIFLLVAFRKQVVAIANALIKQLDKGAPVSIGPFSIGEPPAELKSTGTGSVAVTDTNKSIQLPEGFSEDDLNGEYKKLLEQEYFLLHAAEVIQERTAPRSGRYRVRVWVESYYDKPLDDIIRVTYRVWNDFQKPIISTAARDTNFDLWLSIYGEFPVLAVIERRNKPPVVVARFIELPGRPPD